jgi:hypothetical protein
MSTIVDYLDRRVDVLAFQGATPQGSRLLTQALAPPGGAGLICAGIQKLAQRFLLELLTERGSMPFAQQRGTELISRARLGYLRTQLDVFAATSSAISDAQQNLWDEESDNDPEDESFASAELLAVTSLPGYASLTIRVTSRAGTSRDVLTPLPITLSQHG